MKSFEKTLKQISLLNRSVEQHFIAYLRLKNPNIAEKEIVDEINLWSRARPGAEHGDGVGRIGDPSRFR
ncbi:MAG: hypothetical protein IT173_16820 [Acidobacteria bacterium]|nr:hypothetical protein [Acidobacteriota bacterium]